jgi:homeobox-leucine zipper protein
MTAQQSLLDLGLSLGGLASQGSLSSSTTSGGHLSPWAAALSSVGTCTSQLEMINRFVPKPRAGERAIYADVCGGAVGDVRQQQAAARASTSPDSAAALSSGDSNNNKREIERAGSGGARSDEEDGAGGRKKLRLSKDQAAVLEECFKTHSTLNPVSSSALPLMMRPSLSLLASVGD